MSKIFSLDSSADEYKVYLVTLQKLVYKYTTKYKGPWHEVKPGFYGWPWGN